MLVCLWTCVGKFDSALSTFFRNVDVRHDPPRDIPLGESGTAPMGALKARAVLIDMEEGVVNELLKGVLSCHVMSCDVM